jgi:hypothetical protein
MSKRLDQPLLDSVKSNITELSSLLKRVSGHWTYEDGIYRMYHQSFKVYYLQELTEEMVKAFRNVLPGVELNKNFLEIINDGTGKVFEMSHNMDWLKHTRPIVEAFMHAKHMLEMMVKYGNELEIAPNSLPSGWASVLYLYNSR